MLFFSGSQREWRQGPSTILVIGLNTIRNSIFSFSELDRDIIVRSFACVRASERAVGRN